MKKVNRTDGERSGNPGVAETREDVTCTKSDEGSLVKDDEH